MGAFALDEGLEFFGTPGTSAKTRSRAGRRAVGFHRGDVGALRWVRRVVVRRGRYEVRGWWTARRPIGRPAIVGRWFRAARGAIGGWINDDIGGGKIYRIDERERL